jgi:hypothetical protein
MEENDVTGYVGKSTGNQPIPLLVHNSRSFGGGALLDHCIVKVTDIATGRTLYQHPRYNAPQVTVKGSEVYIGGELYARCKDELQSWRLAAFMRGNRHAK